MTNVKHQQGRWERKRGEQSWEKIFQLNMGACLTPEILPEYQKGYFLKRPKPPNEEDVCKLEGGKWAVELAQERAEAGRGGGLEGGPQKLRNWRPGVSAGRWGLMESLYRKQWVASTAVPSSGSRLSFPMLAGEWTE